MGTKSHAFSRTAGGFSRRYLLGPFGMSEKHLSCCQGDDKQEIFDEIWSEATKREELVLSILAPSHFTSLQVVLKAMIEGFIRNRDDSQFLYVWSYLPHFLTVFSEKRRTNSALAVQDMQLLCSWYTWLSSEEMGKTIREFKHLPCLTKFIGPRLVVLVQDIEICNSTVVHDLLHICRLALLR